MVEMTVHIDGGDAWAVENGTHARGNAFADGTLLDSHDLAALFDGQESQAEFRSTVESLNGYFAVVHQTGDDVFAAVDRHQTMPLFYGWSDDDVYLSDDARWIRDELGATARDPLAETEFLLTGYVTGGETLYPDIRQLQAGELLASTGTDESLTTERYYRYQPSGSASATEAEILDRLDDLLVDAFERLIEFADGRPIVVPLSGGYDSRLIVLMLDRLDYDDIIAFSYGKSWDPETTVSEKIADEVGVQWECVEYSTDRWHDWFHSEEREQYYEEAFNYGALPGLTNLAWPAIWELVRSGRVPDDAVFAPGHTAVSPSEHLPDNILEDDRIGQAAVVKYLKNANYKLWGWDDEALDMVLNDRIRRDIETESFADPDDAARGTAEWYWQERQAKFINGDMQVYEFWNHDWWMPLWDHEFTEFWQSIPLEYREDKAIYRRYVDDLYTEHTGVETEEAQETEMSSPIRRAHQWLYHSPVFDVIRPLYALARYDGDPRGWPGVMSRKQFASLFTGRQRAYSFFALEILDKMSFEPAENIDTPSNGKLSVDVSELEARQQARGQDIPGDVLRELPS